MDEQMRFHGGDQGWTRYVRRAWWWVRRVADIWPWTALGMLVAGAAVVALKYLAFGELDLVLLVAGYGALGLLASTTLLVVVSALVLKWRMRSLSGGGESRLETGRWSPTKFAIRAPRWVPLIRHGWEWEVPDRVEIRPSRTKGELVEETRPKHRGAHETIARRLWVEDVFGLVRIAIRHRQPVELEVLPHVGALARLPILASLAGGDEQPHPLGLDDGDRVDLRRYVPGDPARFVHWKIFGRTRKLMVRIPERALTHAKRVLAYQIAGAQDDASAAAARATIESGSLGLEWKFCADGNAEDASTVGEAVAQIVRSGRVGEGQQQGQGLHGFLRRSEREGPAAIVIFAPPVPGPWLSRLTREAKSRGGRFRVVIGVDGLRDRASRPWWQRIWTTDADESEHRLGPLEEVLAALGSARCDVVVVDRVSGRVLGDVHRAAVRRASLARAA